MRVRGKTAPRNDGGEMATQASDVPIEPTRDLHATLPDLLDALLDRGVYLDLDLIVTVADIPLIGVSLRAVVAGVETMLEHGMMRAWDAQTREWVRRSLARQVPLDDDEDVLARTAGGHRQTEPQVVWRPGTVYLTTRRLMVWRAEPREVLWEIALDDVERVDLETEESVGGEERTRLAVSSLTGRTLLLVAAPDRFADLLRQEVASPRKQEVPASSDDAGPLLEGRVWHLEEFVNGAVWRGGTATVDRVRGLTWRGTRDARAAVRLRPDEIDSVERVAGRTPVSREMLLVSAGTQQVRLATDETARWMTALGEATGVPTTTGGGS